MDDFNINTILESRNEWSARLINILTPIMHRSIDSIFNDAKNQCKINKTPDKTLQVFQSYLLRIKSWNPEIINNECKNIIEKSKCNYLPDIISNVHIAQLKALTATRTGQKQKKIQLTIPDLPNFIHKCYIHCSVAIYTTVYNYNPKAEPLEILKGRDEIKKIIQQSIVNTIRESIPIESIIAAYMDETEEEFVEEVKEEIIKPPEKENIPVPSETTITFNDIDYVKSDVGNVDLVTAPKTVERLEEISTQRNIERKMEEQEQTSDDVPIIIGEEIDLKLDDLDETLINEKPASDEIVLEFDDI